MRKNYLKYIILVTLLLLTIWYLVAKPDISVEAILTFAPEHPVKAAAVVLMLYAVKSVLMFFPLIVLEITVGHFYPLWAALMINLAGSLIILTIPYWTGRIVGMQAIQKLEAKYPRIRDIVKKQQDNGLFLCFFLRVIRCLPGDVVTMYMGATHTPFWKNLLGGALGLLPGMVLSTIMGGSIREPGSPAFLISAALTVILSASSFLLYRSYQKKGENPN